MCQNVKCQAIFQNFRFQFRKSTTFKIFARTKFRKLEQISRKSRKLILAKINTFKVTDRWDDFKSLKFIIILFVSFILQHYYVYKILSENAIIAPWKALLLDRPPRVTKLHLQMPNRSLLLMQYFWRTKNLWQATQDLYKCKKTLRKKETFETNYLSQINVN